MKKALLILAAMSFMICSAIAQMAWSDSIGEDMPIINEMGNADGLYVVPNQNSMVDKDQNRNQETDQWHPMMVDRDQSKLEMRQGQESVAICICECEKAVMDEDSYQDDKNKCDYSMRDMDEWSNRDQMDYGQKSMMREREMGQDDNQQCGKVMMDEDYCGNKMDECDNSKSNWADWSSKDGMDHGQKSMIMSWKEMGKDSYREGKDKCDYSMRNMGEWSNRNQMNYGQKFMTKSWRGMGQDDNQQCGKVMMDENYCGNKMDECDNSMANKDDWGSKDGMDYGQKSMMKSWKGLGQDDKKPMIVCVCACQSQ